MTTMRPFLVTEIEVAAVLVAFVAMAAMCVMSTAAAYRRGLADGKAQRPDQE